LEQLINQPMNQKQCMEFVRDLGDAASHFPNYKQELLPKLYWLLDTLENMTDFELRRIRRDFDEEITHKTCSTCLKNGLIAEANKPVAKFNKNRSTRDGYQYNCAMCQSKQVRNYREKLKLRKDNESRNNVSKS